ncbi:MAG: TolC family outer membrane protein [Rhodoferax sp.]|jgi:outer membrane protein|nr:TolC family outer membrane protein [Rhodoferax sp.]MBJ7467863.1 TolC family outer membrane protein [Rhodoferax sp.]
MKKPIHPSRLRHVVLLMAIGMAPAAQAQSLVDLYAAARDFDASYQSAKAQNDANLYKADQAMALVLPKVGINATWSAGLAQADRGFNNNSMTLDASQALYRPADDASYAQSRKAVQQAASALQTAEQELILRLSQAYFDVLASADSLEFVKAQKVAVQEQLAAAKRNFEVGTSTITDAREAQARFDLVLAQEIAAENDLRVKTLALAQLVGKSDVKPLAVAPDFNLSQFSPADMNEWLAVGQTEHPAIRQLNLALEVARLETQKANAAHMPTVDLVARYQATTNNGSVASSLFAGSNAYTLGFNINMPLFSGYSIQNRVKETLSLEDKARSDLEAAQRNVAQSTRAAFMGVDSALGQVRAYQAAAISSQSALDANKLGYQVGVRINIDVLNSQSQLYDTKAKLSKARYDVLVGNLKLRQASGILKAADLQAINALLR